jgi:hypothetical protein
MDGPERRRAGRRRAIGGYEKIYRRAERLGRANQTRRGASPARIFHSYGRINHDLSAVWGIGRINDAAPGCAASNARLSSFAGVYTCAYRVRLYIILLSPSLFFSRIFRGRCASDLERTLLSWRFPFIKPCLPFYNQRGVTR